MSHTEKRIFPVLNMHCAGCANNVERIIRKQDGVSEASVNLAANTLSVVWDNDKITPEDMHTALSAAGYSLIVEEDSSENLQEEKEKRYGGLKRKVLETWILAMPVMLLSMFSMNIPYSYEIQMLLTLLVMIRAGSSFYIGAWKQLKTGGSNMDTLVALSTSIAFLFSVFNTFYPSFWTVRGLEPHVYYEASVMIIAFVLTGKLLEERAKGNTSAAIRKLMKLTPKEARILRNGEETTIPVSQLRVGDKVCVRPGEQIPVDGYLLDGSSYVDESMISGEPVPVFKEKDSHVLAGTINQRGAFVFRAEKVGGETVLARIIRMVQEAQGSKTPVQRIVDRVTGVFVPVVVALALVTVVVWFVFGGVGMFSHALLSAVSVLVIACPCALGLATPTALMVGIGKAADYHILIKDAVALEQMRKVDAVVLDKTGTLTEGRPVVTECLWLEAGTEEHKSILLTAELKSEHPLAVAIVAFLKEKGVRSFVSLDDFESITGKGIRISYGGATYWVGSHRLLADYGAGLSDLQKERLHSYEREGGSVIYFGCGREVLAVIVIKDRVKPTSEEAVNELRRQGIEVFMLTGDGERTAATVARQLGNINYMADAYPDDKEQFVRKLQREGKTVAMIGDGINDSQALACADVSIAMGKGTDIAMDVAMVTLMTSDLLLLPKAFSLSRQTVRVIHRNLFWAFIYNLITIPVAAGVLFPINGLLLNPMLASAAMAFSSVSVVLSSLRLRSMKL